MFTDEVAEAAVAEAEAAAAERGAVLAKELATGGDRPRGLRRRRGAKQLDITSRQLPPLYDWTAAAEIAETVGHDRGVAAAAAPSAAADDWNDDWTATPVAAAPDANVRPDSSPTSPANNVADLWGVGSDATASAAAPKGHVEPSPAPADHDWSVHDWDATPAASVQQAAPEFETLVAFEAPAQPSPTVVFEAPLVPVAAAVAEEPAVVSARVDPDDDAVTVVAAAALAPSTNAAGLAKRVRGAHMPDTGPAMGAVGDPNRSAEGVRSALSRFQSGVRKGQEEAEQDPDD